jgi:hypothetical protein
VGWRALQGRYSGQHGVFVRRLMLVLLRLLLLVLCVWVGHRLQAGQGCTLHV